MSKETAVPAAGDAAQAAAAVTPAVEKTAPAAGEVRAAGAGKRSATAAAVEKTAARPKAVKKAVAAKPAPAAQTPAVSAEPAKTASSTPEAAPAEAPKAEKTAKTAKVKKPAPKKTKLVRDSFTLPEAEYALFATLKQRALMAGIEAKKSEILRAAMTTLAGLDDAQFARAIGRVERIKTGRPKK